MALAVLRTSLCKPNVLFKGGRTTPVVVTQVATLNMRATHGEKYPYGEPFPYESKKYTWWRQIGDHSRNRLCENSKVITVDGNIGVGKNDFAEKLCKEFDLKLFPAVTDADIWINPKNGLDLRLFNELLPDSAKFYDLDTFGRDTTAEKSGRAAMMQLNFYITKFKRYCKALQHLLSTGQGVVLVNSVYSDNAYLETLKDCGYIKRNFHKNYYKVRDNTICELMKPHLCIYLDTPLSVVREQLDQRREARDAKCTDRYIQCLEKNLNTFKDNMRANCEIMDIDWTEPADELDMDWIAEEITNLKLDSDDSDDPKFHDWFQRSDDDLDLIRVMAGDEVTQNSFFNKIPVTMDSPELFWSEEDEELVKNVVFQSPLYYGRKGYIKELNDNPYLKIW